MRPTLSWWLLPVYYNPPGAFFLPGKSEHRAGSSRLIRRLPLYEHADHERVWQSWVRCRTTSVEDRARRSVRGSSEAFCPLSNERIRAQERHAHGERHAGKRRVMSRSLTARRSAGSEVDDGENLSNPIASEELMFLMELLELDPSIVKAQNRRKQPASNNGGDKGASAGARSRDKSR